MGIHNALGSFRRLVLAHLSQRPAAMPIIGPVTSFTFDDFPRSALHAGGGVLEHYGARGTYYAAIGLMNNTCEVGPMFTENDISHLVEAGHELGSHTFSHASCRRQALQSFRADVARGKKAVEKIVGSSAPHQFSYPYGHVTARAKAIIGAEFLSCRGIEPGINEATVDLNLLRANALYSYSLDLRKIDRLMRLNEERKGWVIFYTHDVCRTPSAYGCTQSELENVIKMAKRHGSSIQPVCEVLKMLGSGRHCSTPASALEGEALSE